MAPCPKANNFVIHTVPRSDLSALDSSPVSAVLVNTSAFSPIHLSDRILEHLEYVLPSEKLERTLNRRCRIERWTDYFLGLPSHGKLGCLDTRPERTLSKVGA